MYSKSKAGVFVNTDTLRNNDKLGIVYCDDLFLMNNK